MKRCIRFTPILHRNRSAPEEFRRVNYAAALPDPQRRYRQRKQTAKTDTHGDNRNSYPHRQRVEPQHQQHRAVLTEVLYRDRITRPDALFTALLQQRIQRHDKETAQHTDQHQ